PHPLAMEAAVAAECAAMQGKFWEYTDSLFNHQRELNPTILHNIGNNLGLDLGEFTRCRRSDGMAAVRAQIDDSSNLGIDATPTIFTNRLKLVGAVREADLIELLTSNSKHK